MENITSIFQQAYMPKQAIIIFQHAVNSDDYYVESYDMDERGCPINAHPLSVEESIGLAKALDKEQQRHKAFLRPAGLIPENVLFINPSGNGFVIWHTPPQRRQLHFSKGLGIPNGIANLPHLLWLAGEKKLHLFAIKPKGKPTVDDTLYHAPFFNIYEDGVVCMGTVDVEIQSNSSLEDFMAAWEHYFFDSYFSHLINGHNPIKGNMVQLWEQQVNSGDTFPSHVLIKTKSTLKKLMSWNL